MMPSFEKSSRGLEMGLKLALTGSIKDSLIGTDILVRYMLYILNKLKQYTYVEDLKLIEPTNDFNYLLTHVSKQIGGNISEAGTYSRVCAYILRKFRDGQFGTITLDRREDVIRIKTSQASTVEQAQQTKT
jgi:ribosome biogenesis GTPase A